MPPAFSLRDVTVTRGTGDNHMHPLQGVSVDIAAGRCTAIVGPSGAGKSTLLRLLNRMDDPAAGEVDYDGQPLPSYDVLALRRRVGLVQQVPVLLTEQVADELRVADAALTEDDVSRLLHDVGLEAHFGLRDVASLSGGEAQRVCVARALAAGPEVLLLDEPTSALDAFAARTVESVLEDLVRRNLTTVLVSHDLRQAQRLADDVIVVVAGTVVDQGPVARVFAEPASAAARRFLEGVS